MDELKTPARFAESMDAFLDEYCRLFTFSGILRVTHRDSIIYERCIGMPTPKTSYRHSRVGFYALFPVEALLRDRFSSPVRQGACRP